MRKILLMMLPAIVIFIAAGTYFRNQQEQVNSTYTIPKAKSVVAAESKPAPKPKTAAFNLLVDKTLRANRRLTADMSTRLPKATDPDDILSLVFVLKDARDNDSVRNEVANLLRRSKVPALPEHLIEIIQNPEEKSRFRAFATQHLGELLPDKQSSDASLFISAQQQVLIIQKLEHLLKDNNREVRREALLALSQRGDPIAQQAAVKWLYSALQEGDEMRDLAIRCVYEAQLKEHLPEIRKYSSHPDEVIRIAAIVALSQWRDHESVSAFKDASNSSSSRLQRAGIAALEKMRSP